MSYLCYNRYVFDIFLLFKSTEKDREIFVMEKVVKFLHALCTLKHRPTCYPPAVLQTRF